MIFRFFYIDTLAPELKRMFYHEFRRNEIDESAHGSFHVVEKVWDRVLGKDTLRLVSIGVKHSTRYGGPARRKTC